MSLRTCAKCKIEKETSEFYRYKDGFQRYCKLCNHAASLARYHGNPELKASLKARMREAHKKRPPAPPPATEAERLEKNRLQRVRYAAAKEARRATSRAYLERTLNDEKRAARNAKAREYAKAHPEVRRKANSKRKALKKNAAVVEPIDISLILRSQDNRCWWCAKVLTDYHLDHRIPLSKGGEHDASNLVASCPTCNMSKSARLPHEFAGRLL